MNRFLEVAFLLDELEKKLNVKVFEYKYDGMVVIVKANDGEKYRIEVKEKE